MTRPGVVYCVERRINLPGEPWEVIYPACADESEARRKASEQAESQIRASEHMLVRGPSMWEYRIVAGIVRWCDS